MHIIVCEDDQLVRKIVSSVLELGGHRVENACDGQEAFEKIQANPGAPPVQALKIRFFLPTGRLRKQ